MDVGDASIAGCYLLVVVGEPYSEDDKKQILQKISKGLLSWDVEAIGCDLSGLENVCSSVKPGREPENELLIQHSNETLAVEVLSNPQVSTLKQCLKNLLLSTTGHKHLIYAGYSFKGTGSWILQNGTFSFVNFVEAFQDADVQKELNSHSGCTIHVHCTQEGEWTPANVEKHAIQKLAKVTLNPPDKIDSLPGASALIQCLESALVTQTLEEMMTLSPLVGNIRFNRPTLYVFPGGQGDCALFGINGFNMLIDGGFNRKPCFWEFIRHLDRLDAVMITRLCESNVCGITTLMKRKAINNIYPQIGYVFCNMAEGKSVSNDELTKEKDDLLVSVLTEGHAFLETLTELKMKPHRCLRDPTNIDPFTLYQKVGHGTLEMYTLSPQRDSKEVKEFLQQWASCKETFSRVKTGVNYQDHELSIPLSHAMSICSLVVWRPANPEDTITRIFFPGSAPQNRIFEGLEKLKNLDVLKQPVCSFLSLHPVEKPKPKSPPKGLLTKNNVTSSLSNGVRRSSESLGSKKDAIESKPSVADKLPPKAPIKKEVAKSPPESKKKEVKESSSAIKKEVKEKKVVSSPKPVELKKTTKTVETNKVTELKSKGLKEVTNKKAVDAKTIKQKPEAPKPKPPLPAAGKTAAPKMTKPSTQSPKHVPKTAETRKAATTKPIKSAEKKKENKLNEKKQELSKKEKLKESAIKPPAEAIAVTKQTEKEKQAEADELILDKDKLKTTDETKTQKKEVSEETEVQKKEIAEETEVQKEKVGELPAEVARTELEKETKEYVPAENVPFANNEVKLEEEGIQHSESPVIEETLVKVPTETAAIIENNEKLADNAILDERLPENNIKPDSDFSVEQQRSATDLFLASASMEGSMHEGLIDHVQDFSRESGIHKESEDFLQPSYEKEVESALATEETIEEKSEKESLHDIMALENVDDEDKAIFDREEKAPDSFISSKEYEKAKTPESADVTVQHEETVQETAYDTYDTKYLAGNESVAVHCEEVPADNIEMIAEKKSPTVPNKTNLSVDIPSYSDDDDDVVKSPTPVAIVDYKDEEIPGSYEVLDQTEKYTDDGPEYEKSKDDKHFDALVVETEKTDHDEEKESLSTSDEEKDEEEEMIRHPTPPGEQNFYEKIGTSDMPTNVEELDTRFMEHYLPVSRQTPDSCHQPLYEEMEDEGESGSASPIVEQPVYSNVVQADYPEFVNISGGTTPSEPQSPKSVHDPKHRLPDASDALFIDTPPQESDEDRFEEEQKRTLTEETSQYMTTQEHVQDSIDDDYEKMCEMKEDLIDTNSLLKDVAKEELKDTNILLKDDMKELKDTNILLKDDMKELKDTNILLKDDMKELEDTNILLKDDVRGELKDKDNLLKGEDDSGQSTNEFTSKSYDMYGIQATTEESILQSKEFVPHDALKPKEFLSDDSSDEVVNQESDDNHYPVLDMTDDLSSKQEPVCSKEETISNTETIEDTQKTGIDSGLSKLTTVTDDLFGSHGMDQSFHESYTETEETSIPSTTRMDQSFHENYIQSEPPEQIISGMDQSFHESYIEREETSEPIVRMDQSFHESYSRTEKDELLGGSRMDQSFHVDLIETEDVKEADEFPKETFLAKENIEQADVYNLQQEEDHYDKQLHDSFSFDRKDTVQTVKDHDVTEKETENLHFDAHKEKFSEYYSEEQDERYTEEVDDERESDDAMDNHERESKDDYITENYDREGKEENYREEREEDENYTKGKYHKEEKHYSDDATEEEGYYGDNERSQFADYDCTTQRTTYSYQSTVTAAEGDTISTERKELLYSTTNGVSLPRDINGHETDMWEDKGLPSYGKNESFQNHKDGYDKSPEGYYNEEQCLYRGMTIPDSAYAGSGDIMQHHYMDTASVGDILLERKEATIEKTSFSSVSCSYSQKEYQEHDDNAILGEYSEHAAGLHDIQKESSAGFRLEDWNKPLGLPSPPEPKTAVKSSTKVSSATKTAKLDKKTKVTENGRSPVTKPSPKVEKTTKPKTNGASPPPVYVDLSYVPHHGDPNYCGVEFFQRIRARYYVFSGINPSKEVLNALLEAKKSWKDDSEVTIIPTYETDTLGYWMALNQDSLIENKIDVAPSASRCTVNLQDHDTSCAAYRLEF